MMVSTQSEILRKHQHSHAWASWLAFVLLCSFEALSFATLLFCLSFISTPLVFPSTATSFEGLASRLLAPSGLLTRRSFSLFLHLQPFLLRCFYLRCLRLCFHQRLHCPITALLVNRRFPIRGICFLHHVFPPLPLLLFSSYAAARPVIFWRPTFLLLLRRPGIDPPFCRQTSRRSWIWAASQDHLRAPRWYDPF